MRPWLTILTLLGAVSPAVYAQGPTPAQYMINTVAGGNYLEEGGLAAGAAFAQVEGLTSDPAGNVYVADTGDHRVRQITAAGFVRTVAGTGTAGFEGDGGPCSKARLKEPYGLAIDRSGNLYIADLGNRRVRRISPAGLITTVAGGGTLPAGGANEGSLATAVALSAPRDVAAADDGSLYISDFGANRVYCLSPQGALTTLPGDWNGPAALLPMPDGSLLEADSGSRRIRRALRGVVVTFFQGAPGYPLYTPTGLGRDSFGNLYIADGRADFMLRFSPGGALVAPAPAGGRVVTADGRGNVYCALGGAVRRILPSGTVVPITGSGRFRYGGDGGTAVKARLNRPMAVALDREGNLFIADTDNHRIRRVTPGGVITTAAGTGEAGYGGDGGPAASAKLNAPLSVACDTSGNLYIADTGNRSVRRVAPSGLINTVAGAAFLVAPTAVVAGPAGELYVADSSNRVVYRIDGNAATLSMPGSGPLPALALDRAGILYVADSAAGVVYRLAPNGVMAAVNTAELAEPRGLAFDAGGNLLVAEAGKNRIVRIDAAGQPATVAGTGAAGFDGDNQSAAGALLNAPAGIVAAPDGGVYVADSGNHRVRKLTPVVAEAIEENSLAGQIVNAASFREGPVAAGELLTLLADLGEGECQVSFDGAPVPLLYVSVSQANFQAPYAIAGKDSTRIEVRLKGKTRLTRSVQVSAAAPGIFTVDGGSGQAAAWLEDGTQNSIVNAAPRGSLLKFFATGEGLLSSQKPLAASAAGMPVELVSAATAPGLAGVLQVTIRLPGAWTPSGVQPLVFTAGGAESQPGVTVVLR